MGRNDILAIIKTFSIEERLYLSEKILASIREEVVTKEVEESDRYSGKKLIELAGIMSPDEAENFDEAISECRKIDADGW
ncbi:MAG: hypothetical protein WBA17_16545 [Saprospiraceae bacterium]